MAPTDTRTQESKPISVESSGQELDGSRKKITEAGMSFDTLLGYCPNSWDKWRCIGSMFLSVATAPLSAFLVGNKLRKQFELSTKAPNVVAWIGVVPLIVFPLVSYNHIAFVMNPMAERKETICPVCLEIRQISVNLVSGSIIPFILFPFPLGTVASGSTHDKPFGKHATTADFRKYVWTQTKPVLIRHLPLTACLIAIATSAGIYFEHKYINKIWDSLDVEPSISDEIIKNWKEKESKKKKKIVKQEK